MSIGSIEDALMVRDYRRVDLLLREYLVEGAQPDDLVSLLLVTYPWSEHLRSRPRVVGRVKAELSYKFSDYEIQLLIGDLL